jgi:hypothetical protein
MSDGQVLRWDCEIGGPSSALPEKIRVGEGEGKVKVDGAV